MSAGVFNTHRARDVRSALNHSTEPTALTRLRRVVRQNAETFNPAPQFARPLVKSELRTGAEARRIRSPMMLAHRDRTTTPAMTRLRARDDA